MDFQQFAARELAGVADRLAEAARQQTEAATAQAAAHATAQLTASFEASFEKLRADHAQTVTENERLTAENGALAWEKTEIARAAAANDRRATIGRLVDTFERIARSRSVDDVLLATAHGLAGEYGRVAVFTGDRRVAQLGAETPLIDPSAGALVVAPITIRGEMLGVVYADDEVHQGGDGAKLVDILQMHAKLALERLTIELKAIAELRAYAQMLLDEVEYVYEADTSAKTPSEDRLARMKENLRCARQIYQQRVTLEGPAAASVLDDVVAHTISAKSGSAFGKDLASVQAAEPATAPASSSV